MTSETETVMTLKTDIDDLVPSEAVLQPVSGDGTGGPSFPKVLRRRLDRFFADQDLSPKADGMMWAKIAVGLSVLTGSWIAIYALRLDAWGFVALYLLGVLRRRFSC